MKSKAEQRSELLKKHSVYMCDNSGVHAAMEDYLQSYASQSAGQGSEVWVRIREENGNLIALALPEPNDKNTYHWIYFSKEHDTVITNFIGTIESVIAFRKHHLNENYTHYCLFKNPTI